jgi:hypothetical protein
MLRYDFAFLQFCIFHFRRHVLVIQLWIPTQSFYVIFSVLASKNCPSTQSDLSTGVEPVSEQWLMFDFPKRQWFVNWNVLVWKIQFLKFFIRCIITRKILKSFSGSPKLLLLSLSVKCKNLRTISSLSRVMSLNHVRMHFALHRATQLLCCELVVYIPYTTQGQARLTAWWYF